MEDKSKRSARKYDNDPLKENLREVEGLHEEYDQIYEFINVQLNVPEQLVMNLKKKNY